MSTITELPAEPELSLPGPIEALGGQKSWRNYRPTRKVRGVEYACLFEGSPVKSTQAISETIISLEIEHPKALAASRLIFLAHPKFTADNTGLLQGNLISINGRDHLITNPEIIICPGKGIKCNFYDNKTLYLSFDGDGLRESNESEKQAIEAYLMRATGTGKDTLGETAEEIEIFKRSSVFGGVAKGRIKGAPTGQGYIGGWLTFQKAQTEATGERKKIYEKIDLKTKDGKTVTDINEENSYNIFDGIIQVYFDDKTSRYAQKSLDKNGHVVIVVFQSIGKNKKVETIRPNTITVPREGNVFIMWVSGQPRYFKKEIQTNGILEEIEQSSVRISGTIHDPSCIDEIDPISGKLIHHKPDSVSQRLENILTGNHTF